jgi:small-conductance mechanosensitive channel
MHTEVDVLADALASSFSVIPEEWLGGPVVLGATAGQWTALLITAAVGIVFGWLVGWPARLLLRKAQARVPEVTRPLERGCSFPLLVLIATAVTLVAIGGFSFPDPPAWALRKACHVVLIGTAVVLVVRLLAVGGEVLRATLTGRAGDPSKARSVATRVLVPVRIFQFLTWVAGVALVCLQFEAVQHLGVSLLASAGVAGVVLGLAAQRTVGNVLAGLQLAFAEQIRIGDTVVAEGEFGVVEEIGLTHVTLSVWDRHRLVLPVSYFVEKPFQNWTKGSPAVLGTVMVYTDFTVPVSEVRAEFERILGTTDLFDGKSKSLDVTHLTADKVELRALVSAADGGRLWQLQCLVRERLLEWLQSHGREYLPIRRVGSVDGRPAAVAANGS